MIDVGCGDGYFLSRILHFYSRFVLPAAALPHEPRAHRRVTATPPPTLPSPPLPSPPLPSPCRHRLAVVGVDIMDFYVYTARARFVSISAELQAGFDGAMKYGSHKPNALFPAACLGSGLDLRWIPNATFSKYIALSPINHFDDQVCARSLLPRLICARFLAHVLLSGRGENGVRGLPGAEAGRHCVVWNGEQGDGHVRREAREEGGVVEGSGQALRVRSLLHQPRMDGVAHGVAANPAIPRLLVQAVNPAARILARFRPARALVALVPPQSAVNRLTGLWFPAQRWRPHARRLPSEPARCSAVIVSSTVRIDLEYLPPDISMHKVLQRRPGVWGAGAAYAAVMLATSCSLSASLDRSKLS